MGIYVRYQILNGWIRSRTLLPVEKSKMSIDSNRVVLIIIVINTIVALSSFFFGIFQKPGRRSTILIFSWFILICPLVSLFFIVAGKIISNFNKYTDIDKNNISFQKKKEKILFSPDDKTEMNYVSVIDAMAVADKSQMRKLIIEILKNNSKELIPSIIHSINYDDTEVSHYAATAILDILSEFRTNMQEMLMKLTMYPDNVKTNLYVMEYIYKMLKMNIMNEMETRSTIYTENDVAENLFQHNLWFMKAEHYLWMTDLLISIQEYAMAENWVFRACEYCSNELGSYKARLHLYFAEKKGQEFFSCLEELKNTDIVVDKEILDLFRIYKL